MTTEATPAVITTPCTFRSGTSFRDCGDPASETLHRSRRDGEHLYEPRCKRHMSAARRAKYENREIIPVTLEVRDLFLAAAQEEERQQVILRAERRRERAEQVAAWTKRTREESKVVYEVVSKAVHDYDSDTAQTEWTVVPVGTAKDRLFGNRITTKPRHGETRLSLSISNEITPNEARGIVAALSLALLELDKEGKA